jgi:DNA-binding MarR family transcriptional regulator
MPERQPDDTLDSLLSQVCHFHHARVRQLFESLGLYKGQPPLLRQLWQQEGLTQSELAARLKITPATVTKMLHRMEKAGFIQRAPDSVDQRISRVYLTDAGRAIQGQVEEKLRIIEEETFVHLTLEERQVMQRLLTQIRENLVRSTEKDL